MLKYSNGLISIGFFCFVFVLTRQVPLIQFPFLLSLSLVTFLGLVISVRKHQIQVERQTLLIFLATVVGLLFVALYQQQSPPLIVKFLIIIILLNAVLLLDFKDNNFQSIYNFCYSLQSVIVIGLAVVLIIFFTNENYKPLRLFFIKSGWGDIYTLGSGYYYRVQLMGNALLPFFFFISFFAWKKLGASFLIMLLAFFANFFAGNLAFQLFIFIFLILFFVIDNPKIDICFNVKWVLFFIGIILAVPLFFYFVVNTLIRKSSGSVSSIGTRFDQFNVLISDVSANLFTFLFGKGLGNTVSVVTHSRDYTGDVYFELQAVYFFNQLGVIFTAALIYIHFKLLSARVHNKYLLLCYFMYLGYASINPYFLDSNHLLVLIMLLNLQYRIDNQVKHTPNNLV